MEEMILKVKGSNGQIELYDEYIIIKREGLGNTLLHGMAAGSKLIFIKNITGIQYLENAFIQFIFSGSEESHSSGIMNTIKDGNTVTFGKKENAEFMKIRDFIIEKNCN